MNRVLLVTALTIISAFALPVFAFSGLEVTTSPEIPRPGAPVTLRAKYLGTESGRLQFTWLVNGKTYLDAVGGDTITLDAPPAGESTDIEVTVSDRDSIVESVRTAVRPGGVTLEWQGDGGTTPFGGTRPLFTGHGSVRILALPEVFRTKGRSVPLEELYFSWDLNGVKNLKNTGFGKQSFVTQPPFFNRPFRVGVTVETQDGALRARDEVLLQPVPASTVLYHTTPLTGVEDRNAITGSYPFTSTEASFIAYPLHAPASIASLFTWKLNGTPIEAAAGDPRIVTFRKTGDGVGRFPVEVQYQDPKEFLNAGVARFLLQF